VTGTRRTRAERRREERRDRRNPARARRSVWRGPLPIVGSIALLAIVITAFVLSSRAQRPSDVNGDATPIAAKLAAVSVATLDAVGSGGLANPLISTGVASPLTGPSGRPVVIYVGADYCPFCASERWSMVVALSRFGRFQGLHLMRSSPTDVFPITATLSFRGSTYTSDVIEFSAVETADRSGKEVDSPTPLQKQSFTKYDPAGSIPYVSIADRAYGIGSGYGPEILAGKSWDDIANALADPSSAIAKAILGNANYLTAAICEVTGQAPAAVCDDPMLQRLPKPK
jgi:thiol-disulfide isomerase/thioredoxin